MLAYMGRPAADGRAGEDRPMIWVAWRQFRTQALVTLGLLVAFAVLVLVTGLHLRDVYSSLGGAHCAARSDCTALSRHETVLAGLLGPALLAIPALLGMFWGAPLVARELESGTYRLAWTQSVTRRRWLSVRVALVGVAALVVAGLASWLVSWWFAPLDAVNMNRFDPSVFTARGVVAIGYAGFAFALGVAAGTLTRRTLPAMAATLLGFIAARIAFTLWVRPHLLARQGSPGVRGLRAGRRVRLERPGVSVAPNVAHDPERLDRSRPRSSIAPTTPSAPRNCTICSSAPARRSRPASPSAPAAPRRARGDQRAAPSSPANRDSRTTCTSSSPTSHPATTGRCRHSRPAIFLAAAVALIAATVWRVGPRAARRPAAGGPGNDSLWRSPRRSRQRSAGDPSASAQSTTGARTATVASPPRSGYRLTFAGPPGPRWRFRWLRVALMTVALLSVAIALPACGGSGSSKPAAVTPARTLRTRSRAPSPIAKASTCANANAQAPAASPTTPGAPLPTTDPFDKWGRPLTHDAAGTILRTRTIRFVNGSANPPLNTTQLLYVTTDELGCRTVSVVTVFQPHRRPAAVPIRLFSYQTSYDALGSQCDPSYTLRAGTEGESGFIAHLADTGYTVIIADYEGEDAAYGVGQLSGYETLDAVRAAERWLGAPEASTPVALLGYSGGAVATEFASELAPTYAPHLDIVGVAEGGIPVDLFHELSYINHPSSPWTGQIPSYLDGLARGFGVRDLNRSYTPEGIKVASSDQTQCAGTFTGLTTDQLFKPRYRDVEKLPVIVRMFDRSIMSRSGTPREPLFIANGLSDTTGDGVTVTRDVQQLAYIYCHRGVPLEFHVYKGLNHSAAGTPFFEQAQAFLARRFKNLPFKNACADIGPRQPIVPLPVPQS